MWHQCQQLPRCFLLGPVTAQSTEGRAAAPATLYGGEQASSIIDTLPDWSRSWTPETGCLLQPAGILCFSPPWKKQAFSPNESQLGKEILFHWLTEEQDWESQSSCLYPLSVTYQVWYCHLVTSWFSKMIYSEYLYIKGGKLQRAELLGKCLATSHGPVREMDNQEEFSMLVVVPYYTPSWAGSKIKLHILWIDEYVLNWLSNISLLLVFLVLDEGQNFH